MDAYEVKVYYLGTVTRTVKAEDTKNAIEIVLNAVNLSSADVINNIFVRQIENPVTDK